MTVSNKQWEKIDKQYNGLLWTISHRISGDRAIASLEDNFADLQIVALEAVAGFEKKTGGIIKIIRVVRSPNAITLIGMLFQHPSMRRYCNLRIRMVQSITSTSLWRRSRRSSTKSSERLLKSSFVAPPASKLTGRSTRVSFPKRSTRHGRMWTKSLRV